MNNLLNTFKQIQLKKMMKFATYAPAVIVLAAIMAFGGGNGCFFGIKTAFGYGSGSRGGQFTMTPTVIPVVTPQVAGASIDLDEVQAQVEALRLKIIALSNQSVLGAATEVSTGVCGSKLSDGGYSDGLAETAKLRAQFCPPDQDGADALMTTGSRFNRAALSTDLDWVNTRIAKQD